MWNTNILGVYNVCPKFAPYKSIAVKKYKSKNVFRFELLKHIKICFEVSPGLIRYKLTMGFSSMVLTLYCLFTTIHHWSSSLCYCETVHDSLHGQKATAWAWGKSCTTRPPPLEAALPPFPPAPVTQVRWLLVSCQPWGSALWRPWSTSHRRILSLVGSLKSEHTYWDIIRVRGNQTS